MNHMACDLQKICHRQIQDAIFQVGLSMKRKYGLKMVVPFFIVEHCFPGILFKNHIGCALSKFFFQKEGAFRDTFIVVLKGTRKNG